MNAKTIDAVIRVVEEHGARQYGREAVSQREHALQCATLAERAGAAPALVVASLLHDVGHLIDPDADAADNDDRDARHEASGASWISGLFGDDVLMPIRLHVAAKRYLTAIDRGYMATLSPQSVRSLSMQGGPFTPAEAERFIAAPHADDAVKLRRWDDLAKDPDAVTPDLDHFVPMLEACVLTAGQA
jgi:phosphonate degradation associated HDIG domain protein